MNYINPNAPAAGLTRLLNMRDNNPSTQLAYVPTKDIAAMGSMGGLEFNPYSGIPQARGIAAVAEGGSINEAPLSPVADELASRGRYGDSMLLHVRPDELQGLASLGTLTINPDTGLPEAFSFKSLLPTIGAIAGAALAPFTGGTSLALTTGLMAGGGAFLGGLAAGQGVGEAALGGLMSGATAGFMAGAPTGIEALGSEGVMSGAGELGVEAAMTGVGEAVPTTAASLAGSTAASAGTATSIIQPVGMTGMQPIGPGLQTVSQSLPATPIAEQVANRAALANQQTALADQAANVASRQALTTTAPDIPADAFARITSDYKAPNELRQFFGADDLSKVSGDNLGGGFLTKQEFIDAGGVTGDMTLGQRVGQLASSPGTYLGVAGSVLTQPPEYEELDIQEPTLGPSYVPRERTLAGGVQSPARSSEEYLRMALEGGYQPLSEQYRYVAQGGLVGLEEGGQPSSLTAMSSTPESQRIRTDMSAAPSQEDRASRVFNDLESRGGVSALMSLVLRNNPQAIQFINQNASSPRNLQLNEMGAGRHSYFDTADTGLYTKAGGGLVRLVEGGTPKQGALQSQLSPVQQQQQQQIPLLQQQEQQISERARQDELLQRDQAMSRGQQFIEQPPGNQQLFQQMQSAGKVIGQQLAQGPQAYATPAGSKAPSTSFSTGADFGFNAGGLVGLAEGGIVSLRRGGEPDQIEKSLPITLQSTMKRLGIKDATPFLEFAQKTKQIESSGGIDRINKKSSARGDFQWLTKVDPKAKKGVHNSVKTAVNRTISSYERMGQEIPQWLKTLNKNSTKSTKDLEENVLSLTPDQELELFFGNIGEAKGSDVYLTGIAKGNQQSMFEAYSDIHHTRGKEDQPTKEKAIKTFFSETAPQVDRSSAPTTKDRYDDKPFSSIYSGMPDIQKETQMAKLSDTENDEGILSILTNILSGEDKQYEVQSGDTLSAIAKQQGMSLDELLEANKNISNPNVIRQGQEVAVPDQSSFLDRVRGALGYAQGGDIGQYFEGQVVGNGDGMSDQILFEVEGNNPDKALLSRDEYVIPADVVAMLGNGSSNAGSEQLDGFIKGIRQDSFGTQKQQQQLNAQQDLRGLV